MFGDCALMVVMFCVATVSCVSLTGDGQCALVSTLDNCLYLIDKTTGELLNEYVDHSFYLLILSFLQRVSIACYAKRCTSYHKSVRPSVCLSVCHSLALCQNDSS